MIGRKCRVCAGNGFGFVGVIKLGVRYCRGKLLDDLCVALKRELQSGNYVLYGILCTAARNRLLKLYHKDEVLVNQILLIYPKPITLPLAVKHGNIDRKTVSEGRCFRKNDIVSVI